MKKLILAGLMLVSALQIQAQDSGNHFGIKLGPNFTTLDGASDATPKVGFHIGLFAEFPVGNNFAIQPELVYSLQGATNDFNYSWGNDDVNDNFARWDRLNLSYLNVPVMLKYSFPKVKGLSVLAGPQFGFLVSAREKGDVYNDATSTWNSYSTDAKDGLNSFDLSFGLGAQYEWDFGLIASLRGNVGLTNVVDAPGNLDYKNRVIQLSAAYRFF